MVADAVEEGVAGDLERAVEADRAVGAGLIVLEDPVADGEAGGAVEAGVGAEAVGHRARRHERLPGRAGRELPLHRATEQRGPGLLGVEPGELRLGDAADPDAGVVGRLAGHRDDATGVGLHHHDRARVGDVVAARDVVVGGPGGADRLGELLLDDTLDLGVDRGDEGVAGLAGDLALLADHPAAGVDRDPLVAGHSAQPRVVLLLHAGTTHRRGAVDRTVTGAAGRVVLLLGDGAEVAEHVGEVDAERLGVGADALLLGDHRGVVLRLLEDPQGDPLGHVACDRHGLEGRPVPAHARDAALLAAGDELLADPARRAVDGVGEPLDELVLLGGREALEQGAVDGDDPRHPVGDQRPALGVDDQAALGLDHDLAHRLVGGLRGVGVAADDLEVVEAHEERREEAEDQCLDDQQPQPAAGVAAAHAGPLMRGPGRGRARACGTSSSAAAARAV